MGSKTRLSSYCTKRANNGVNLATSRKINTRLARPILSEDESDAAKKAADTDHSPDGSTDGVCLVCSCHSAGAVINL